MDQINIQTKEADEYTLMEVKGSVNSYTYTEFQNKVYDLIKEDSLCIDMEGVTSLSSAGLGVLMTAIEEAEFHKHKLFIYKPSEIVRLAIQSTGFMDMFTIIKSTREL